MIDTNPTNPMDIFFEDERTALFIDGAHIYAASRNLGFDVDYAALLKVFKEHTSLINAYYYSAILDSEEYSPLKPLTDWLAYNGYTVVTKAAKEYTDSAGRRRVKGNMDIEIAVNMLRLASKIEHVVLFSNEGDFKILIEEMQNQGVKVTVISTKTPPQMVADDLRRQANNYIDLSDIGPLFTRRQTEPRARRFDNREVAEVH